MRKSLFLVFVALCVVVSMAQGADGTFLAPGNAEQLARKFVSLLAQEKFEKATEDFDANMKAAISPHQLRKIWMDQLNSLGICRKIENARTEFYQQYRVVFVSCQFEKQRMDVKVVIGKADKIAGLFFVPAEVTRYQPPAYAKSSLFIERDVTVGAGEWMLPGTLSMPVGKGPFPALVLVHGSGSHDRDETIGPNKPFRDLAWGLVSQSIAVLRYEKRTKQYAGKIASSQKFTVKEETIEDALAAVSLLQETKSVDRSRVFILGHSLGGMLMPRIGTGNSSIAGFVVVAGPARPLEDLVLEQRMYQASLVEELSVAGKNSLEETKQEVEAVKKLSGETSSRGLLLNAPASYWLDLQGYDPPAVAGTLNRPMLILQGEKDCQVNPKADFERWRQALSGRKNVVLKTYPTLNHLFMEVNSKSTGAEYYKPGNVAEVVVNDIAAWIGQH